MPITKALALLSLESCPKDGPTILVSSTSTRTGNAPERSKIANCSASSTVRLPLIVALPPVMTCCTTGLVSTLLSSKIFRCLPTFWAVISANFLPPSSVNSRATKIWLFGSITARASFKSLPVKTVTSASSLNSSRAVLPSISMAFSGSLMPGNSIIIRFSPWRWTIGSVRPSSLIRFSRIFITRLTASSSTLASGVSKASSKTCVPPCKSSPCFIDKANGFI